MKFEELLGQRLLVCFLDCTAPFAPRAVRLRHPWSEDSELITGFKDEISSQTTKEKWDRGI